MEEFKRYEKYLRLKEIIPKNNPSIILSEEILVNMIFDSNIGFTISFEDLNIQFTNVDYEKAFEGFNDLFYDRIIFLVNKAELLPNEKNELSYLKRIINNIHVLKQ